MLVSNRYIILTFLFKQSQMALTLPSLPSHKVNDMNFNYSFPKLSLLRLSHAVNQGIKGSRDKTSDIGADGNSGIQMLERLFLANYL